MRGQGDLVGYVGYRTTSQVDPVYRVMKADWETLRKLGNAQRRERTMACWTIDGGKGQVCFADSVTEIAFGPLFQSVEDAEDFAKWLNHDPRKLTTPELIEKKHIWERSRKSA